MTPAKTTSIGRRPSVDECLEAWWRVTDGPAGKLLPDQPRGVPGDDVRMCDPFDLYCWRLVSEAIASCRVRRTPPSKLVGLLAHRQRGGAFAEFAVYDVIVVDASDPSGWRSTERPVGDAERLGLGPADLARSAVAKFRRVLQRVIDRATPYLPPARESA